MLQAIFNFFKKPAPAPVAPTPYKVETPTQAQRTDSKPVAKKATAAKPVAKKAAVKKTPTKPRKPKGNI